MFLGFAEAESTRAVALAEGFMTTQAEFGNEPVRCVRKAGTGAAIVAEVHGGVQTVIRSSVYQKRVSEAVYVHLKAHSLNLPIGHACKEPLVCAEHFANSCICIQLFS